MATAARDHAAMAHSAMASSSLAVEPVTSLAVEPATSLAVEPAAAAAPLTLVSARARVKWLVGRGARCLALVAAFYIVACLIGLSPVNSEFRQPTTGTEVFIYTDHVQSKILLPAKTSGIDWRRSLTPEHFPQTNPDNDYVAFSWGDRDFALNTPNWSAVDGLTAAQAVLLPSEAVMHVEFRQRPEAAPGYRKIVLNTQQLAMLAHQISCSFRRDRARKLQAIEGASLGSYDAFFEANGTFYFLNTGNNWTGTCLKRSGIRTGMWTPFTVGLAQVSE